MKNLPRLPKIIVITIMLFPTAFSLDLNSVRLGQGEVVLDEQFENFDQRTWNAGPKWGYGNTASHKWVSVNSALTFTGVWGFVFAGSSVWQDYQVETTIDFSESTHAGVTLLLRAQDSMGHNYYGIHLNQLGTASFRVVKDKAPARTKQIPFSGGSIVKLVVGVVSDRITVNIDGKRVANIQDSTFQTGRIGFYVNSGSGVNAKIEDVKVTRF